MTAAVRPWAREVLRTWFHEFDSSDWYGGGESIDRLLRDRFEPLLPVLGQRPATDFGGDRKTALAAIILFDQFTRNIHRGSAQTFAYDPLARAITHHVIGRGWLPLYNRRECQFVLMPLMHSEEIGDQRLSLDLFAEHAPNALDFARSHWRMVARFGRFPHRNRLLGRKTTEAEQRAIDAGFSW